MLYVVKKKRKKVGKNFDFYNNRIILTQLPEIQDSDIIIKRWQNKRK